MNVQKLTAELIDNAKAKYSGYNITDASIYYRDCDNVFEILGLVPDPTVDANDFRGREILFPKRWVTLDTITMEEINER